MNIEKHLVLNKSYHEKCLGIERETMIKSYKILGISFVEPFEYLKNYKERRIIK